MKRFFKENWLVIVTGVVVGLAALLLQALGNPKNMGFCIACFERDIAGALGLHSAAVVQYVRPEVIGIVLGSCIMALIGKEFRAQAGSSPATRFAVGALVMTNFGTLRDLRVAGDPVGERLYRQEQSELKDKGSIIIVLATDVPLSSRQLERVAKRAQSGIARTGGISGNGSGEIALAFTTGNKLAHYSSDRLESIRLVYEEDIDEVFRAAIESVDEAIISSMLHASAVTGRAGNHYKSLADLYKPGEK